MEVQAARGAPLGYASPINTAKSSNNAIEVIELVIIRQKNVSVGYLASLVFVEARSIIYWVIYRIVAIVITRFLSSIHIAGRHMHSACMLCASHASICICTGRRGHS